MMMRYLVCAVLAFGSFLVNCHTSCAAEGLPPLTVKQVIEKFKEPVDQRDGFFARSDPGNNIDRGNNNRATVNSYLEVEERLYRSGIDPRYTYKDEDKQEFLQLMNDDKASIYARLCAVSVLLSHDESAQEFLKPLLADKNLRTRYNAAQVLLRTMGDPAKRKWSLPLLIELVQSGALDGSDGSVSPSGEFPEGDGDDIMLAPLDQLCWNLGFLKEKEAVPALIAVLKRKPATGGAAFALGEIGDPRAIPILLDLLEKDNGYEAREVTALGKFKAKEAVPGLMARLKKSKTADNFGTTRTDKILEALLEIDDKQAIPAIEAVLQEGYPESAQKVARRVLVQMKAPDKVAGLLELLAAETDEHEAADLIWALARQRDPRVIEKFLSLAQSSDWALLRRNAILGLRELGDKPAQLALASLLEVSFPKTMKHEMGKGPADYSVFFPQTIEMCLEQTTGQKLGRDRAAWEKWIKENPAKNP